jgi:hypothetical protein
LVGKGSGSIGGQLKKHPQSTKKDLPTVQLDTNKQPGGLSTEEECSERGGAYGMHNRGQQWVNMINIVSPVQHSAAQCNSAMHYNYAQ